MNEQLVTRSISQLPRAVSVPARALVPIQPEFGPVQAVPIDALFTTYRGVAAAVETFADLADELDRPDGTFVHVYADPDPDLNGYYRKAGAPGIGTYESGLNPEAASQLGAAGGVSIQDKIDNFDAGLWNYKSPILDALDRPAARKFDERVSWLDFLPKEKHTDILNFECDDDFQDELQAMMDNLPPSTRLYIPGRVWIDGPLLRQYSIDMFGDGGREDFDNSWDHARGSQLLYRGNSGDALTFRPIATGGNNRMKVALSSFCIRGHRFLYNSEGANIGANPDATGGGGLVLDGIQEPASQILPYIRDVHVAEAKGIGWLVTGAVYGGYVAKAGAHDCGLNGRKIMASGPDAIGELLWMQTRWFANGHDADPNTHHADGVWDQPGVATNVDILLSSSENAGNAITKRGGAFSGIGWHWESVPNGKFGLELGDSDGNYGVVHCIARALSSSPRPNFTGKAIMIWPNAFGARLEGIYLGDTLGVGGVDIDNRGRGAWLAGLASPRSVVVNNYSYDSYIELGSPGQNAFGTFVNVTNGNAIPNATGDGTDFLVTFDNEIQDTLSEFNGSVLTAPTRRRYRVSATVLIDNLNASHNSASATLRCSNNAKTISERYLHPYNCRDSSGYFPMKISGIFDLAEGEQVRLYVTVHGAASGTKDVRLVGGDFCRIQVEAL